MSTPRALPSQDTLPHPDQPFVSEALYWEKYYEQSDIHYEWNHGRLEEKPLSDYLTYRIYAWLMALLEHFLTVHPMAKAVGLEMGFRMTLPGNRVVIRKPDLGVVRNDNAVALRPQDRSYQGIFDLCIEALSDSSMKESARDEVTKKLEYAAGGVPEYYILHHNPEKLRFYLLTRGGVYRPIVLDDGIIRSHILPGFQFRQADLMRRPPMAELRLDPVYQGFVLPGWQAETERREVAESEAEAAQQRALGAEGEAVRLRASLAQGVLALLAQRGLVADEALERRIECCRDDAQLRRWLLAATHIKSLDQLDG